MMVVMDATTVASMHPQCSGGTERERHAKLLPGWPVPQPLTSRIQVGVFLCEAEAQQVLAAAGPKEGGTRNRRDSGTRQQRPRLFDSILAGNAAGISQNVVRSTGKVRREPGIAQRGHQAIAFCFKISR